MTGEDQNITGVVLKDANYSCLVSFATKGTIEDARTPRSSLQKGERTLLTERGH